MKRSFSPLLAAAVGLMLLLVPGQVHAATPVSVTVSADKTTVVNGDTVTLTINTGALADLYGATVDVYFDTNLLQVNLAGTSAASVLTTGSANNYTKVVYSPATSPVSLVSLRLGTQPGYTGPGGTLGTVQFTAVASGTVNFTLKAAGATQSVGDVVVQLADHDGATIPVAGTTGTLTGTVGLDGRVGSKAGATVSLMQGSTLVATTTTDSTGAFTIADVPTGTYTAYVRRSSYQTLKVQTVTITATPVPAVSWTLYPGNIVDDGTNPTDRVGLEDLLAMAKAWGSANPAADLNGDGTVNTADLTLLQTYWGDAGADSSSPNPASRYVK